MRVAVLVACLVRVAYAFPDLRPEIYGPEVVTNATVAPGDVAEGCASGMADRTLVRFGVRIYNVGSDALERGNPGCPDCRVHPGELCSDPDFICSPAGGHGHPHYLGFARYTLVDLAGNVIALGKKVSFCLLDSRCGSGIRPYFIDCAVNQGVSAGCWDDYNPSLGCQYIDVTDAPIDFAEAVKIRVTLDPDERLEDGDRSNNVVEALMPGRCGNGQVDEGEVCDPAVKGADCCSADCRLRPAATTCRPATGSCDRAEACDGTSIVCPADGRVVDGTACTPDGMPCVEASCAAGDCVVHRALEGCAIDGTCVAPGATAPGDPCRRCEPVVATDRWSPDVDPDATGLRCQVERIAMDAAALGCRLPTARAIKRRLRSAKRTLDRLLVAPSLRRQLKLERRLSRLGRVLDGRARKEGCATAAVSGEVELLRQQLRDFPIVKR